MQRELEALLKMNESSSSLDQSFKIVSVRRFGLEPKLFEHVVRLIITFFIPAMEKCAIEWMFPDVFLARLAVFTGQLCYEPRNLLAFVHEGLNLLVAQMMSKPARTSFPEMQHCQRWMADSSQPIWLSRYTK
jgi:hypothetical protein